MDSRWIIPFILIILTRKRDVGAHECSTSETLACREEIQDLRRDKAKYYYATDNRTLAEMCRKQVLVVKCVNSFAEKCLTDEEQAYFKKLVLGSDKFLDALCFKDSELKKRYLLHSSCLRNISKEFEDCSQRYDVAQTELDALLGDSIMLLERTCCIYFEYIQCSSNVTLEACGKEAAQLVSELLTLLSGTYLTHRCQPYSQYDPETCTITSGCERFVPNTSILWTLLLFLLTIHHILK